MSKYEKWYASIIENAKARVLDGYKERHHIIPRSIGGADDRSNLVDLTAREHFICHWLLVKIHTGEAQHKMIYALNGMKRNGKDNQRYETPITSRVYQHLKEKFGEVHSQTMKGRTAHNKGKAMSEEQKAKIRQTKASNPWVPTDEIKSKIVKSRTGTKHTEETRAKMSLATKGKSKGPMSEEGKKIRSLAAKGKPKSAEHTAKRAETLKALAASGQHHSAQKKTCPHCGTEMNRILYGRWHGDNCKQNPAHKT